MSDSSRSALFAQVAVGPALLAAWALLVVPPYLDFLSSLGALKTVWTWLLITTFRWWLIAPLLLVLLAWIVPVGAIRGRGALVIASTVLTVFLATVGLLGLFSALS